MNYMEMLEKGGRVLGFVGLQNRPVIEYEGEIYEKAIHFDNDGLDHNEMYHRVGQDAEDLRRMIGD